MIVYVNKTPQNALSEVCFQTPVPAAGFLISCCRGDSACARSFKMLPLKPAWNEPEERCVRAKKAE